MRKFLITMMCIVMVVCFMPTVAFAAENVATVTSADGQTVTGYETLQDAIGAAQPGEKVELLCDVNIESSTLVVNKAITIDGGSNKYSITGTGYDIINVMSDGGALEGSIIFSNLTINAVADAKVRAITFGQLTNPYTPITKMDLTVQNCEINTKQMGIVSYSDNNNGITLKVIDSTISMAGITDYDKVVSAGPDYNYSRGISLYQMGDSTVTVSGSTIQGFYYSLNNADNTSSDSMTVNVANSTFKCRAAINDWTDGTTWNINNSTIHGINTFTGSSEQFANIVLNSAAEDNIVNINECSFTTYFSPEALANENALQHMVDARGANNKIYIDRNSSGSSFTSVSYDKGQIQKDILGAGSIVEIYGGTFNIDPRAYVANGYEAEHDENAGTWTVRASHVHNFNVKNTDDAHKASDATCTSAAKYYYSCECGEIGTETYTGSALGHLIDENDNYCERCDTTFKVITIDSTTGKVTGGNTFPTKTTSSCIVKLFDDLTVGRVSFGAVTSSNMNVTFDLNGHVLTVNNSAQFADFMFNDKTKNNIITFKNGTIREEKSAKGILFSVKGKENNKLIFENTLDIICNSSENTAVLIEKDGKLETSANIAMNGTNGCAIQTNGSTTNDSASIAINGGNIESRSGVAIYLPAGNLTITGGTITGSTAVYAKANVTINDGSLIGNGGKADYVYNGNGCNSTGDALVVDSCNYPNGVPDVHVTGGIFTSLNADAVGSYVGNGVTVPVVGFITGGTFTSDPKAYVPANSNYYVRENADNTYTVYYSAPYIPPTTPTDNVTNSGTSGTDNATTSADLSGSTSTSNGTTSSTVDKTTADKIVDKAVENKSEEIVIDATANSTTAANSTTIAQVTIPTETLGAIAEKTEADVTIKTDVAEVKLDNASAAAVAEQAEGDTVQIIAEKVKEDAAEVHFELKVVCSDGKVISDFKGGNVAVTVALPKEMAEKKVVCVYIDDNGHMSKMEGKKNADGTYTFNTGHFSSYAIMAEEEADAAIAAQKEAIKNIKIKLTSKQVKTKAGKKAVKITWTADAGDKVLDGVEVFRSTERYKGYGTEPFYTSTKGGNTGSYTNTKSLKKGTRYYYRVRGYVLVDGQKVYTDYSTKAWRTV